VKAHSRNPAYLGRAYVFSGQRDPNAEDCARARRRVPPGGEIMIHGTPNRWRWVNFVFPHLDWTAGCIAVSDRDIEEIWKLVPNGTVVEIRP
jgi:murein L,D-transpeptidase YafK